MRSTAGLTLLEILVTMAILLTLATLLLPAVEKARARARQASCASRLHQIGILAHAYAHDHNERLPAQVRSEPANTQRGSLTSPALLDPAQYWRLIADGSLDPSILICPADTRPSASSMQVLQNSNVSYFVGLQATLADPDLVLSGDRNIIVPGRIRSAMVTLRGTDAPRWTAEQHEHRGNLLFADSRVEFLSSEQLASALRRPTNTVIVLSLPGAPRTQMAAAIPRSSANTARATADRSTSERSAEVADADRQSQRASGSGTKVTPANSGARSSFAAVRPRSSADGDSASPDAALSSEGGLRDGASGSPTPGAGAASASSREHLVSSAQAGRRRSGAAAATEALAARGTGTNAPAAHEEWDELTTTAPFSALLGQGIQFVGQHQTQLLRLWLILLGLLIALTVALEVARRRRRARNKAVRNAPLATHPEAL